MHDAGLQLDTLSLIVSAHFCDGELEFMSNAALAKDTVHLVCLSSYVTSITSFQSPL
jgi:hypothetical protein